MWFANLSFGLFGLSLLFYNLLWICLFCLVGFGVLVVAGHVGCFLWCLRMMLFWCLVCCLALIWGFDSGCLFWLVTCVGSLAFVLWCRFGGATGCVGLFVIWVG